MPLLFIKQPLPQLRVGIWRYGESVEELFQISETTFIDDKRIHLSGERMKIQRLGVRVLLKTLTGRTDLGYSSEGKPFLPESGFFLSISHTNELAAVAIHQKEETGVDIELMKPRITGIADKFMSETERQAVNGSKDQMELLHIYWCAKEALYKLYGNKELIFKENLLVLPFTYDPLGGKLEALIQTKDMNRKFSMCYEKVNGHMLVYIMNS
jgi:4'-phosphopantetheinyl transferase